MFSKTCEYAIRALLYIAQKSESGTKTGIREIAKNIDSPEHFIAKILQDLSRKGMVQSLKGPNGGFFFEESALNYTLADVVRTIDGDKIFSGCALGLKQCSENKPCPLHSKFADIRKEIVDMLHNAKLGTFSKELQNHRLFLKK